MLFRGQGILLTVALAFPVVPSQIGLWVDVCFLWTFVSTPVLTALFWRLVLLRARFLVSPLCYLEAIAVSELAPVVSLVARRKNTVWCAGCSLDESAV